MLQKMKVRFVIMGLAALVRQAGAKKITLKVMKVVNHRIRKKNHKLINRKVAQRCASMGLGANV